MKSNQILALVLVGLSVALGGCSGGGTAGSAGIQCTKNYNPTNMNVADDNKQKIALEKVGDLAPGTYLEVSASLYYVDPNFAPNDNFREEIRDTVSVDEKTKTRTNKTAHYCARNTRADLQNIGISVAGVSKMVVAAGAPVDSEARTFSFNIGGDGKVAAESKTHDKPSSVGKVYETAEKTFIFKRSETEIEIRSQGSVQTSAGQTGTYYLTVLLVKQP